MLLFFQTLRDPLLEHALVVEIALTGQAFEAGEHARVDPQGDRGRFVGIGGGQRALHEAQADLVLFPEFHLLGERGKRRDGFPIGDDGQAHGGRCIRVQIASWLLRS
jgi:hypothetical protein